MCSEEGAGLGKAVVTAWSFLRALPGVKAAEGISK
jgi:hypothetical protein